MYLFVIYGIHWALVNDYLSLDVASLPRYKTDICLSALYKTLLNTILHEFHSGNNEILYNAQYKD